MNENDPGLLGALIATALAALSWLVGEGGKIAVAGGFGGLSRWLSSETRTIRDGLVAWGGGILVATYLWPGVFWIANLIFGQVEASGDNVAACAFIAGALGMSFVKVLTAMVEARAGNIVKGGDNAE